MDGGTWALQGIRIVPATADEFESLFKAEYARVVGVAARVLGDRAEAEEVAQDVFLDFQGKHSASAHYARPWLYRAAWHAALNKLRGNQRRKRRELASHDETVSDDPALVVEKADERAQLRSAMRRLPKKSAAVLALRYSGLSYAEVGAALGVSAGQVGTLLRRAEARLRKEVNHAV